MLGYLGRKLGMTQKFDEKGDAIPVTVIKCGPCTVIDKRTKERDGYCALQLGFEEEKKAQKVSKSLKGHFQKAKTPLFKQLGELRTGDIENINVGDSLNIGMMQVGDNVNVVGTTKGRGFQGVIKRHGKSGGAASHGSHFHRAPGSIGMCADPSRVIKGMGMPGHMGTARRTLKNLKVIEIDLENNLLFVKGAVPGSRNGLVMVTNTKAKISDRLKKEEPAKEVVPQEKPEVESREETK